MTIKENETQQDVASPEDEEDANAPPPGSWAETARFMASLGGDDGFDWDDWKDRMKDGDF